MRLTIQEAVERRVSLAFDKVDHAQAVAASITAVVDQSAKDRILTSLSGAMSDLRDAMAEMKESEVHCG